MPLLLVKWRFRSLAKNIGVHAGDWPCWGLLARAGRPRNLERSRAGGVGGSQVGSSTSPAAPFSPGSGLPLLRHCIRPVPAPVGVFPRPGSISAQSVLRPPGHPLGPSAPEQRLTPTRPLGAWVSTLCSLKTPSSCCPKGLTLTNRSPSAERGALQNSPIRFESGGARARGAMRI